MVDQGVSQRVGVELYCTRRPQLREGVAERVLGFADAGYANTQCAPGAASLSARLSVETEHGWKQEQQLGDHDYRFDGSIGDAVDWLLSRRVGGSGGFLLPNLRSASSRLAAGNSRTLKANVFWGNNVSDHPSCSSSGYEKR